MSTTSGMELVQVAVARQIKLGIDAEMRRQEAAWASVDRATAALMAVPYRPTKLIDFKPGSYVLGDRPSILRMPWDFFPAINVVSTRSTLAPEGMRDDYSSVYTTPFYIEVTVPCDPFPKTDDEQRVYQQGVVDRRCKRSVDAVVQCLLNDRTIGGISPESQLVRDVRQTPPFEIEGAQTDEFGDSCIFSLARVDAQVDIYAALPGVETVSALLPLGVGLGT